MTTQLLTLSVNQQASGAKKILFQDETYLKQITSHAASGARSLPFTRVGFVEARSRGCVHKTYPCKALRSGSRGKPVDEVRSADSQVRSSLPAAVTPALTTVHTRG